MAIPIGKLALYTAACGYADAAAGLARRGDRQPGPPGRPALSGYRAPRLRGAERDALVEAFVTGVEEVWPGCPIQFETSQANRCGCRPLPGARPPFNDDIRARPWCSRALAALRATGSTPADTRRRGGRGRVGIGPAARDARRGMAPDVVSGPSR